MFKWFKSKQADPTNDNLEEFEEVQEKRTTTAGYLLLIIMAIFLITVGETVFRDLRRIPKVPIPPSSCIASITGSNSYNYGYDRYNRYDYPTIPSGNSSLSPVASYRSPYSPCVFNEIDRQFGLEVSYNAILPDLNKIAEFNKSLDSINSQIASANYSISDLERQYSTSLQEKIANEQVLYNRNSIQQNIISLREQVANYQANLSSVTRERDIIVSGLQSSLQSLKKSFEDAQKEYRRQYAWYRIKIFLLMLIFVVPFFGLSTKKYFTLKAKNSPYTVIATSIMVASAFLFLQTVLTFLYDILPREFIEQIIRLFSQIPFLRYVLYYGVALLVIVIFGGLVYLIQRRIFNTKKVAIRRLKDSKCPACSFSINQFQDFCPKCGTTLKEKCVHCGNMRIAALPFCPVCGKTKGGRAKDTPNALKQEANS